MRKGHSLPWGTPVRGACKVDTPESWLIPGRGLLRWRPLTLKQTKPLPCWQRNAKAAGQDTLRYPSPSPGSEEPTGSLLREGKPRQRPCCALSLDGTPWRAGLNSLDLREPAPLALGSLHLSQRRGCFSQDTWTLFPYYPLCIWAIPFEAISKQPYWDNGWSWVWGRSSSPP